MNTFFAGEWYGMYSYISFISKFLFSRIIGFLWFAFYIPITNSSSNSLYKCNSVINMVKHMRQTLNLIVAIEKFNSILILSPYPHPRKLFSYLHLLSSELLWWCVMVVVLFYSLCWAPSRNFQWGNVCQFWNVCFIFSLSLSFFWRG